MGIIKIKKRNLKLISIIIIDLVIVTALILYFGLFRPHINIKIKGTYIKEPSDIAEFSLIDHQGHSLTKEQLKGHWTMMFFGFTHCPMICPTTMTALDAMYEKLQKELDKDQLPTIVFITVDPERDTIKQLNRFMSSFNDQFIGARADKKEIIDLEKQLHIAVPNDNPINHSTEILLLNPDVKVQAYFSFPFQPEQLALDYKTILNSVH